MACSWSGRSEGKPQWRATAAVSSRGSGAVREGGMGPSAGASQGAQLPAGALEELERGGNVGEVVGGEGCCHRRVLVCGPRRRKRRTVFAACGVAGHTLRVATQGAEPLCVGRVRAVA